MENQKTNPWMMSTLVLVGIIVGFGVSQIPTLKNFLGESKTATIQQPTQPQQADPNKEPEKTPLTVDQIAKLPGTSPFFGDAKAPVTIVEFSDFQCPYCQRFVENSLPQIEKNYISTGKVRLVYRDFPLDIHPQAPLAALVGQCANEQGKFREMHDALFNGQQDWSGDENAYKTMKGYATKMGLDMTKFDTCVTTKKYADVIKQNVIDGVTLGVNGTPGFFVNGKEISGAMPYEVFKAAIDAELAGKKWELQFDAQGRVSVNVQ